MDWRYEFERFHDTNRYFIPLSFIALILMLTGVFYLGPTRVDYDVLVNRTLLFDGDAVILAVTLRPGWTFNVNVLANKPVSLSVYNLEGITVASSLNNTLSFTPSFLDLYFVKVSGSNYAILDFNYSKIGYEPYSSPYLFFGTGLALLLGVVFYYLLEPWKFKLTRKLGSVDAVFYPLVFLLSSVIFWIFRDVLVWFLPKSSGIMACLVILPSVSVLFGLLICRLKRKMSDFSKVFVEYFIAYSAVFLMTVVSYTSIGGYYLFVLQLCLLLLLALMRQKTALVIYSLTWLTGVIIRVLAYSVGIPVLFDMFLSVPNSSGMIPLFMTLEGFMVLGVYLFMRGYCSRTKTEAVKYGLYAGVCIQAFLQVFTGTSLL